MTEEQKSAIAWAESAIITGFSWTRHVKALLAMIRHEHVLAGACWCAPADDGTTVRHNTGAK